jgi:hypothetical protein
MKFVCNEGGFVQAAGKSGYRSLEHHNAPGAELAPTFLVKLGSLPPCVDTQPGRASSRNYQLRVSRNNTVRGGPARPSLAKVVLLSRTDSEYCLLATFLAITLTSHFASSEV